MSRQAKITRQTNETKIELSLELDGSGRTQASTGVGFFDHMLDHLGKHSMCDLSVQAQGDVQVDYHHTVEDVGIALGQALKQALGDKAGIRRYGFASTPMDEALADAAIDLSGRSCLVFNVSFASPRIGEFDSQLVREFFEAFCREGGVNLHINVPYGANDHHVAEAVFKAVAQALRGAKEIDPARGQTVPSTKGSL